MLLESLGIRNPLEAVLLVMLLCYFPLAVYQMYLVCYSIFRTDKKLLMRQKPLRTPNNVIVAITTNGMATDVVEKIIRKVRSYKIATDIFVIKEERDEFIYSCRVINVPANYKCKNRSRNKMRAMQYGIEELHRLGYGKETYICHLDDDSVVDKAYLRYVKYYLSEEGAQGCIRLRAWG